MNMKIVELYELQFSQDEFAEVGDETVALLATLCHAANELNLFMGLFISCSNSNPSDKLIAKKWEIQRNTILRVLNAKTFEAIEQIPAYRRTIEKSGNEAALKIFDACVAPIEFKKDSVGYQVARYIRDKVTNHYLPSVTRQHLKLVPQHADRSFLLHRKVGDSFYPFGEEYVFNAALNSIALELSVSTAEALREWLRWSNDSIKWINESFDALAQKVATELLPQKVARQRKLYLEESLTEGFATNHLPLFQTEYFRAYPFGEDFKIKSRRGEPDDDNDSG